MIYTAEEQYQWYLDNNNTEPSIESSQYGIWGPLNSARVEVYPVFKEDGVNSGAILQSQYLALLDHDQ